MNFVIVKSGYKLRELQRAGLNIQWTWGYPEPCNIFVQKNYRGIKHQSKVLNGKMFNEKKFWWGWVELVKCCSMSCSKFRAVCKIKKFRFFCVTALQVNFDNWSDEFPFKEWRHGISMLNQFQWLLSTTFFSS